MSTRKDPSRHAAPWSWAVAGAAAGLLVVTLLQAPASWLARAVGKGAQGRLLLQDARGSIWNGSARVTLTGGAGSQDASTLPGRLDWAIRPKWSGLSLELRADCCLQQPWRITVQPRWGGARVSFSDALSQWPAQWLTGLGTPWNTVQPEGQLALSTRGLAVEWAAGRMAVAGRAELNAAQISSRLSTLKPMGSYRITLHGGAAPYFAVETLEGSLQLSGKGQWAGLRLRFEGEASAPPERQEALSNLLNILGRREGLRSIIKVG